MINKSFSLVHKGASIIATLAWIFSMVGINSCEFLSPNSPGFLYCHPPPEPKKQYGSCGDCHCINGDKPCPTDPKEIPLTNVPDEVSTRAMQLICDSLDI